jgi:hypothetical protein
MTSKAVEAFSALVADALNAWGEHLANSGGMVAGQLLSSILRRRIERAREIAFSEIRTGEKPSNYVIDADEVVAIVYKYLDCARQGTARHNLRLMARIMCGQAALADLQADEFLTFADILRSLRHEEVCTLATSYRVRRELLKSKQASWAPHDERQALDRAIEDRLVGPHKLFRHRDELNATKAALQRTGMIALAGTRSDGTVVYAETPLLERVGRLAMLENPLPEETENSLKR